MRLLFVVIGCLAFTLGANAQSHRPDNPAGAGKSDPQFTVLTYSGPSLTSGEAGPLALNSPVARVLSSAGQNGNRYDQMVTRQMEVFDRAFETQGLSRASEVARGGLKHGGQTEFTYRMTAGSTYGFAAVCDQDCSDLDLVLINASGQTVKRDLEEDDKPVITYRAPQTGTYRLQVRMAQCSQSPCRFGLAAYVPSGGNGGGGGGGDTNKYDQIVTRQMEVFDRNFASEGLSRTSAVMRGSLNHNRQTVYTYQMTAGRLYGFAAVCDQDCSDLDLVLLDEDGQTVKRDLEEDDKPIIAYRPSRSGTYRLQVRMAQCSQSPCRFGLAVYQASEKSKKF